MGTTARAVLALMIVGATVAGASASAGARKDDPRLTVGSKKLSITFQAADPEHVVDVEWKNHKGVSSGNLVADGGPVSCSDPSEFWGQAYGAPEGTTPNVVFTNHVATIAPHGPSKATITGATTDCASAAATPVTTHYSTVKGAPNEIEITRRIGFSATSGMFTGVGVRPYVPRLADSAFTDVLLPNGSSTATTDTPIGTCPFDCFTAVGDSWNGQWLADVDPTNGDAMIIRRDPSMTTPVEATVNYDGYSASNLSSFVLVQPKKGWKHAISETEYLCFVDLTTWPQTARSSATLPSGCSPTG
jgi:hypothetical protein